MAPATKLTFAACVTALLLTRTVCAQDDFTVPVAGSDEPVVDVGNANPALDTSSDDGTLRADVAEPTATFGIGRRLHLSANVNGGYDDNVNTMPEGSPSWFISPNGTFSYEFGNERLAFTSVLGGGFTYYFDHPGGRDYDPNLNLRFAIAYKASPRLTFNVSSINSYQSQPDYTTDLNINRRVADHFRSIEHISASYRLSPRLTSVSSYSLGLLKSGGSNGAFNDQLQNNFSEQLRYLALPNTTVSAEYRYGTTKRLEETGSSNTQTFNLGVDQSFSPRLTASLKGGLQIRSSAQGDSRIQPYFQSDLRYLFGSTLEGNSSGTKATRSSIQQLGSFVSWMNRYAIEESDIPGGSSRTTYRTHLQLSYPITDRITATIALIYFHGTNEGATSGSGGNSSSTEDLLDIAPTVRYAINPRISLTAGYRHTEFDRGSDTGGLGAGNAFAYGRSRYFAGFNVVF